MLPSKSNLLVTGIRDWGGVIQWLATHSNADGHGGLFAEASKQHLGERHEKDCETEEAQNTRNEVVAHMQGVCNE